MNIALRITATALLLMCAVANAAGTSYRWTDAQGKIHFGDLPPPGATGVVETGSMPANSAASPPPTPAASSGLGPEECDRKLKQLQGYQNATSITETDGLGNRRDYTDDERKKLIARTQQAINDGCPQAN
jgi:hypothetical protein